MMALVDNIPWGLGKVLVLLVCCLLGLLTIDYVRPRLSLVFAMVTMLFLIVGCTP